MKRTGILSLIAALGVLAARAAPCAGTESLQRDLEALTKNPNRLAGLEEGSRAAGRYVEQRLKEMGVKEIYTQEFPVLLPRMRECELEADGERHRIYAARPNVLQASVTPADGLAGETIYAGRGEMGTYGKAVPEDKIVVLDFDCERNWVQAFALGARAVLFVEEPDRVALPFHHVNVPANLPRFYVPADLAEKLELKKRPRQVKIRAACVWEELRGRNVIGVIRGTGAVFNENRAGIGEAVLLAAPLDSLSEVPDLSPGGRDAANIAVLLHTAGVMAANPPRRDVVTAFFDGQTQNHTGARMFYGAVYRKIGIKKVADLTLEDRLRMIKEESGYVKGVQEVLAQPGLFDAATVTMENYDATMRMLRSLVQRMSGATLVTLRPLRNRLENVKRDVRSLESKKDGEGQAGDAREIERLKEEWRNLRPDSGDIGMIDRLEVYDLAWNSILRLINKRTPPSEEETQRLAAKLVGDPDKQREELKRRLFRDKVVEYLGLTVDEAKKSCARRLDELKTLDKEVNQGMRLRDAIGKKRNEIVLHVSVNLGDAGPRWCFVHGDDSVAALEEDVEGIYNNIYKAIRLTHESMADRAPSFEGRSVSELYSSRLFAPAQFVDSGYVGRLFGRFNLGLVTVLDSLERQGLPCDTPSRLRPEVLFAQGAEAAGLLRRLADHKGLSRDYPAGVRLLFEESKWETDKSVGQTVKQIDLGDALRAASVPDAVVAVIAAAGGGDYWPRYDVESMPPGFMSELLTKTRANGIFEIPPIARYSPWQAYAATFDQPESEEWKPYQPALGRGLIGAGTVRASGAPTSTRTYFTGIARMHNQTFVGYGFDRIVPTTVMRALSTSRFRDDQHLLCESGNILSLFAPVDAKATKMFNPYGLVLLSNKPTKEDYLGVGIPLTDPFDHPMVGRRTADDLYTLNAYRLNLLRENQIGEESLEVLHGRAGDIKTDAANPETDSVEHYHGLIEASAAFSRRMYGPLVAVMNDLVTAVVFLLLLAIPFAFAMERLLIGTPHIYHRIGWFAFFFVITFGILYMVNPAFKLAATPIIIFLAFTIILLSSMVIFIMVRKLQSEMKKLQGRGVSAHTVDVSRISTMAAAVSMGISTMRRRPLRTLLTSITVVLLTFTILTFASFSSVWGNKRTYVGPMTDAPARIMIRHPLWDRISPDILGMLVGYLTGRGEVSPRYWLAPLAKDIAEANRNRESLDILLATADMDRIVPVSAAVGLDVRDVRRQENLRGCFSADARLDLLNTNGIFLTKAVAQSLNLTTQDVGLTELVFKGRRFTYGGSMEERFAMQTLLEGSSILPVDYKTSAGGGDEGGVTFSAQTQQESESASFVTFNADSVAIIPAAAARRMGAQIRSLTVYTKSEEELEAVAEDVAAVTALPTYVGGKDGVYRLFFMKKIEASGFRDLVIPVILGGLIIFATMLGSVADREREIYAFSSLGLAPAHVAMLFFAEASIYAVVGGMGGYLMGQVVAKLLAVLSRLGHLSVPSMNFSSMNAVATIFIVMGIVLLSTIYPALKAARSANPGIQRAWKMSNPIGDVYDISFPFTVSEYDLTGIVNYLREYFEGYTDASIGTFATIRCRILRQKETDMLGFAADVALAPFDLGIEQGFVILSQPSDVEGIDEVRVLLKRKSGSYGDWRRATRVFINDLRKQFLIWRTLDEKVAEQYREQTLEGWETFSVESRAEILVEHGVSDSGRSSKVKA